MFLSFLGFNHIFIYRPVHLLLSTFRQSYWKLHACLSSKAASNSPFQTIRRCMKIFTQQREWGRHIFQPDLCFSTRSRTEWRTESQLCSTCPAPDPFWLSVRRGSARPTLRLTCWSWGKALSTGAMWKSVILNAHWLRAVQLKLVHI